MVFGHVADAFGGLVADLGGLAPQLVPCFLDKFLLGLCGWQQGRDQRASAQPGDADQPGIALDLLDQLPSCVLGQVAGVASVVANAAGAIEHCIAGVPNRADGAPRRPRCLMNPAIGATGIAGTNCRLAARPEDLSAVPGNDLRLRRTDPDLTNTASRGLDTLVPPDTLRPPRLAPHQPPPATPHH